MVAKAEKVVNLRKQSITKIAATMDANYPAFPVEKKPKLKDQCLDKHAMNIERKSTVQLRLKSAHSAKLLSKSLNKNSVLCIKKCAMSEDEGSKLIVDNDRKMQFSLAMDLASESQGFSERSGVRLKVGHKGSCTTKRIRRSSVRAMQNNSITKAVNPSFKKYPKHLRVGGAQCLKEDLTKFVKWPGIVRKKRSSSKVAREEFGTLSTDSLPNEVVEEILSRLPVKSLVRFRCVCKSWHHHLSYSERLISLHLQNYRASQLLVGTCNLFKSICCMYFLPPPPLNGGYSENDVASRKMMKHGFPRLLDGSCNGVVCLYSDRANEDIVLWNPATKESKIIPKSWIPRKQKGISFCTVGFGFDPKTKDYKILRMVFGGEYETSVAQMELYSLRKDSWRKVDSHDFFVMRNVDPADVACRLPFTDNRIVCAVVSPLSGPGKWETLLFDMSRETYEIIPMPPTLDEELGGDIHGRYRKKYCKVFSFKETVALGIAHFVGKRSYCDIWVLNNCFNSTTQSRRCWSKLLSTNINDRYTVPVGCWGSELLFQEKSTGRLFRFDNGNNIMVEIGVFQPSCVTTSAYQESLVRINDIKYSLRTTITEAVAKNDTFIY